MSYLAVPRPQRAGEGACSCVSASCGKVYEFQRTYVCPKQNPRSTVKRDVFTLSSSVAMPLFGLAHLSMPPLDDGHSARAKPVAKVTDRDLVDRAKGGDAHAFGQLVRRHQQRIHRLAVHMLRDRAEAEDVTQETFIRAYQALARFDGRSEPYTWFYRITVNLSLNTIRARKTARTGVDADDPRLDALVSEKASSPSNDPRGQASRKQLYLTLCEGIDGLSDTLRTTLILVCIDGRSHEEAAQILGAPEGTIAWRVHEARRKLREFMSTRGFDPEETGT
jgi:RNA polymerase sigma-70 factor (ECF subfamily)